MTVTPSALLFIMEYLVISFIFSLSVSFVVIANIVQNIAELYIF